MLFPDLKPFQCFFAFIVFFLLGSLPRGWIHGWSSDDECDSMPSTHASDFMYAALCCIDWRHRGAAFSWAVQVGDLVRPPFRRISEESLSAIGETRDIGLSQQE